MDQLNYTVNRYQPVCGATNKIMKILIHNVEGQKVDIIIDYYRGTMSKEEVDEMLNWPFYRWCL